MIPEDLRYTKDHEWVRVQGGKATIGITAHAQEQLGELTYVELPALNRTLKAHDVLAVVESSKAASEVYAPVAGQVVEVNGALEQQPELINQDGYQQGWICAVTLSQPADVNGLMTAAQYAAYLKE